MKIDPSPLLQLTGCCKIGLWPTLTDKGLAQAERGEGIDGEGFMQGLIEDLDTRESKRKAG